MEDGAEQYGGENEGAQAMVRKEAAGCSSFPIILRERGIADGLEIAANSPLHALRAPYNLMRSLGAEEARMEPETQAAEERRPSSPLKEAMRAARIEAAERSAVIVELRDAEAARLEILNEALAPVFTDIPTEHADLFDRGLSQGSVPRLWIDMVAHVAMGRDKRTYRLVHDTAYGRRVLAESTETGPIVEAVTKYVARRLIAREQAMVQPSEAAPAKTEAPAPRASRGESVLTFLLGIIVGAIGLFILGVYLTR
jgi:hypothetical protein